MHVARREAGLGGVGMALALIISACAGPSANGAPQVRPSAVVDGDPRKVTGDSWQIGYCISQENEAAQKHEQDGEYGTESYAELLSDRPCTLDLAFGYGDLLAKHHLTGEKDFVKVWRILSKKETKFRDRVIRFADGYAEHFINQ